MVNKIILFFVIGLLSLSFVSAGWWSDVRERFGVAFSPADCQDTDPEGDPNIPGVCIDGHGRRYEDRCISGSYISYQYKCAPNGINCVRDGGSSACIAGLGCIGSNHLNDGNPGACVVDESAGSNTGSSDSGSSGASQDNASPSCVDNDGSAIGFQDSEKYVKNSVRIVNSAGGVYSGEDYCDGSFLLEYYCVSETSEDVKTIHCENGCSNGGCLDASNPGSSSDSCVDECSAGATRCSSQGDVEQCISHATTGCLIWHQEQVCSGNDVCHNGACVSSAEAGSSSLGDESNQGTSGEFDIADDEVLMTETVGVPPVTLFDSGDVACQSIDMECHHLEYNCVNTGNSDDVWKKSAIECMDNFSPTSGCVYVASCSGMSLVQGDSEQELDENTEETIVDGPEIDDSDCVDTDGSALGYQVGELNDPGRVEINGNVFSDRCVGDDTIREYYCATTGISGVRDRSCGSGNVCIVDSDGLAYCGTPPEDRLGGTCHDSDSFQLGYQESERLVAGWVSQDGQERVAADQCQNATSLSEAFCSSENIRATTIVSCGNGYVCETNSDGIGYCDEEQRGFFDWLFGLFGN